MIPLSKERREELEQRDDERWSRTRAESRVRPEDTGPIFICDVYDPWGALCVDYWYSPFLGPSKHPYCEEFPECDFCKKTRNKFLSVEQYIDYRKALCFESPAVAAKILRSTAPTMYQGDHYTGSNTFFPSFDQGVWSQMEYDVLLEANMWKFSQSNACRVANNDMRHYGEQGLMRDLLLSTGERSIVVSKVNDNEWQYLVMYMGRVRDTIMSEEERVKMFGDVTGEEARVHQETARTDPRSYGEDQKEMWGENVLGRVLMEVRSKLRAGEEPQPWADY